jgi:hypothetical protein
MIHNIREKTSEQSVRIEDNLSSLADTLNENEQVDRRFVNERAPQFFIQFRDNYSLENALATMSIKHKTKRVMRQGKHGAREVFTLDIGSALSVDIERSVSNNEKHLPLQNEFGIDNEIVCSVINFILKV